MKTLIAIPCMDTTPVEFTKSLIFLEKGPNVNVCFHQGSLIYDARNCISITAINDEFDYVLWLDSDIVFPINTLKTLRKHMEVNPDIHMVSGVYFKRNDTGLPVIYDEVEPPTFDNGVPVRHLHEYKDFPRNDFFPIRGCGFGCVMTSVHLLRDVWDKQGNAFTPLPWAGEDISFCHKVNQLGYKIWCDSSISCGHIGQYMYGEGYVRNLPEGSKTGGDD